MREIEKDPQRLYHILEAINNLLTSTNKLNLENLSEKDLNYFGIVKLLEIIGEASYKLTNEFRNNHQDTPWDDIIGMRHILVHGYYQVEKKFIINTIRDNLLPLKKQIEKYLLEIS